MDWKTWVAGGDTVSLGDERIWYRIDGSGPTLFFVHGFPTSSHDWEPVVERLADRFRCVTFDLLGFGASSKPKREYTYALQHEALAKVAAAADVTRATLVVHDYAVTLGQDFLLEKPKAPFALDGIVFLNGGLDAQQHRARLIQRIMARRPPLIGLVLRRKRVALRSLRKVFVKQDALPEDDAWAAMASNDGIEVLPRLLHYMAERRERRDELVGALGTTSIPKAFIWGMGDPVSGAHLLASIRPRIGDSRVRELNGIGHYPQLEAPEEVANFVSDFTSSR